MAAPYLDWFLDNRRLSAYVAAGELAEIRQRLTVAAVSGTRRAKRERLGRAAACEDAL